MIFKCRRSAPVYKAKIYFWRSFVFIAVVSAFSSAYAKQELERAYSIRADFRNLEKRTFSIGMDATITNHTEKVMSELLWVVYPNRFLERLPNLGDLNYRRIYPNGFSQGYLTIKSLLVEGNEEVENLQMISLPPIPEKTLYSLQLKRPLSPGETRIFHFDMELKVPKKYGSFGFFKDRLTMSGGWTPYLVSYRDGEFMPTDQPPRASWEVKIVAEDPYIIGSEFVESSASEKTFTRKNLGQVPIQIRKKINHVGSQRVLCACKTHWPDKNLRNVEIEENGLQLQVVLDEQEPDKILETLESTFKSWSLYTKELALNPELVSKKITFVQAPLREMLGINAQEVSFFSDRTYKLIQSLYSFHNVPLIRLMFSQMLSDQIIKKENDRDYVWINEVISDQLTEDFLKTQHYKHRDARKIGLIRYFSMLPLIDQIIHTPQFAFFDVFYNFVYPFDPVRDEFTRFQNRRQYGHAILAHMIDEMGEEKVEKIVRGYISSPDQTFLQMAEKTSGQNLSERFEHWTSLRPVVNYDIAKFKSKKTADGFTHTLVVKKETTKPIQEPVEIRIEQKKGESKNIIWDSKETEQTFTFDTQSKVKSVEIDPRQRLLETKLSDNRTPPYWKFVLTQLFLQYDFVANQPDVFIDSQIRRKYGGQDRYNIGGYYLADSYGGNIGYTRLFGQALDRLRLSHGFGVQYNFGRLSEDGVFVDSTPPKIITITDGGFLTSLSASYFFGNQVSYTNPLEGESGSISFTYGSTMLGGNFNYYKMSVGGTKIVQLHPSHLLAFRGEMGTSGSDSMPTQVMSRLGGILSMRGLGISDEKYIGRNHLILSAEYRHFLIQDCDWNLWLFRIRDVQGALFSDAGRVTDTVQEKANRKVLGNTSPSTSFVDLFEVQNFETDMGYGLRFFVDYFGVSPGLFRFDLAKSLSDSTQPYRLYFGVTQSF